MTLTFRMGLMSNVNIPIETLQATSCVLVIAMFVISVTVCDIFTVEICMILALTFRTGRGQMQIYRSKENSRLPMNWQCDVYHICHRLRHLQSKYARSWTRPLEWTKVECKYTNRKPIGDFLCIGDDNFCSICHRLLVHHAKSSQIAWFESLTLESRLRAWTTTSSNTPLDVLFISYKNFDKNDGFISNHFRAI